jgi:preprotein translocase subunit SecA
MIKKIFNTIFISRNDRLVKSLEPIVRDINAHEAQTAKLSDAELQGKTAAFKQRIEKRLKEEGFYEVQEFAEELDVQKELKTKKRALEQKVLDEILPEAFAVVREAARRVLTMRHFDVQLVGGIVLHQGKIAEMATGEGKTLVATLPAYLNALSGRGVHIITVNDYLARRDRNWMGPLYEFLGLRVGVIQHGIGPEERRNAYACDITYGTNNEFGFDYLRDNMVSTREEMVQRDFHYAIVDEVDSILIDEARTPLIISGPSEESTELYYRIERIFSNLTQGTRNETEKTETGDYIVDEKSHTVHLTEEGEAKVTQLLRIPNLHDVQTMQYRHHVEQMLKAHALFQKDVDYIVKDNEVIIVDEFTGRLMPGRRWSDGLHQAVEAKEGVKIEQENQTLATITFQNYFRMYEKLAGMTGTAFTEALEFSKIYNLDVVVIPTNKPLKRVNYPDMVYRSEKEKFEAIAQEIIESYSAGKPVLVGTISIEKSEKLSAMLKMKSIPHNVLNAKYHEHEAHIVAQAGRYKQVTIATNMAGRGTDILLGGNPDYMYEDLLQQKSKDSDQGADTDTKDLYARIKTETDKEHDRVVALGGLHVIGTERHDARRIDNQLRGRSGRQGDPGSSRFYVSLEDDLMRIFGSDKLSVIMQRLGMEYGQAIESGLVSRAIENAQKRVESHNFEIRKQLLEFDDVMNKQREIVYTERKRVLFDIDLKAHIFQMIEEVLDKYLSIYGDEKNQDFEAFAAFLKNRFNIASDAAQWADKTTQETFDSVMDTLRGVYAQREKEFGDQAMAQIEKIVLLRTIDTKWKDHLLSMDGLREGIGLRAYGQKDPLLEYKHEGFRYFEEMIDSIKEEVSELILKLRPLQNAAVENVFVQTDFSHPEVATFDRQPPARILQQEFPSQKTRQVFDASAHATYKRQVPKVGRNDPCPCGSGKKYKHCCGK